MARIAYILLCHKDPEGIIRQAEQLTAAGDCISIHFDANAARSDFERIREGLATNPRVTFARRRIRCGWGEWSLVAATLEAVRAAVDAFPRASHFYMVSGDCMPIKSARYIHDWLDRHDADFIESVDFFTSGWIKTGLVEERLVYRHFFNERRHKRLFYLSLALQQKLGLRRAIPKDLRIHIGSQWWCLRRDTVEKILAFLDRRRDVVRFFSTTWIPDETFFQTLVRHLVPEREIVSRTPTFLVFSDYGMPVNFYNDHYDLLLGQDYLFARKISPDAKELKERLGALYVSDRTDFAISNEGRNLYHFLAGRGRIGRRFGPRFWERESSVGRDRELLIVVCKKWHVAKRFAAAASRRTGIRALEYVFNEESAHLPPIGGIERSLAKRQRHRRALMRMLFEYYGTGRMIFCLDPWNIDILRDFFSDRCTTRLLEIQCTFSDDYLIEHAKRIGIAADATPRTVVERLLPTIRSEFALEAERLRDAGFPAHLVISETRPARENAEAIAEFLEVDLDTGLDIARTPYLFDD